MDDAEVERLKKQIEALQTQFGAVRERTVAAEAEVERLKETNQKQYDEGYAHGPSARLGPSFEYVCELRAEVERLKGQLLLTRAEADGAGSMMLSVQQDCIKERQRANRLQAEVERLKKELGR